jgi:hypothetical protein
MLYCGNLTQFQTMKGQDDERPLDGPIQIDDAYGDGGPPFWRQSSTRKRNSPPAPPDPVQGFSRAKFHRREPPDFLIGIHPEASTTDFIWFFLLLPLFSCLDTCDSSLP